MKIDATVRRRRDLMSQVIRCYMHDKLFPGLTLLPLKMVPRSSSSCTTFSEREKLRSRILPILGVNPDAIREEPEEILLDIRRFLKPKRNEGPLLTISTESCDGCPDGQVVVTDSCRGCEAESCRTVCPRGAVSVVNGRSFIDQEACVSCGLCIRACRFSAIVKLEKPCRKVCPTNALIQDEQGIMHIDERKCIACGACYNSCPFGAVTPVSELRYVIDALRTDRKVTAIIAPSFIGQYPGTMGQLITALKMLGFTSVYDVAVGADMIATAEAEEWKEAEENGNLLLSSCCPAYQNFLSQRLSDLKPSVSHSPSPMVALADHLKERDPRGDVVFIGPCIAKKDEARKTGCVDYVLTFEELGALLVASAVDVQELEESAGFDRIPSSHARGFAISGGVLKALSSLQKDGFPLDHGMRVEGFSCETVRMLKQAVTDETSFIELMACEGGCINGPGISCTSKITRRKLLADIAESDETGSAGKKRA